MGGGREWRLTFPRRLAAAAGVAPSGHYRCGTLSHLEQRPPRPHARAVPIGKVRLDQEAATGRATRRPYIYKSPTTHNTRENVSRGARWMGREEQVLGLVSTQEAAAAAAAVVVVSGWPGCVSYEARC